MDVNLFKENKPGVFRLELDQHAQNVLSSMVKFVKAESDIDFLLNLILGPMNLYDMVSKGKGAEVFGILESKKIKRSDIGQTYSAN
jgi:hypothetical protein